MIAVQISPSCISKWRQLTGEDQKAIAVYL